MRWVWRESIMELAVNGKIYQVLRLLGRGGQYWWKCPAFLERFAK